MKPRPLLFVVLWILAVIFVFWMVLRQCFGGPPTQGSGAADLMAPWPKKKAPSVKLSPNAVQPPKANTYYFSATATDRWGSNSDYSVECIWTNTTKATNVVLAWNTSGTNVTNYTLYVGTRSAHYSAHGSYGTNLIASWPPKIPKTQVITVTYSNKTSVNITNPAGTRWFTNAIITRTWK